MTNSVLVKAIRLYGRRSGMNSGLKFEQLHGRLTCDEKLVAVVPLLAALSKAYKPLVMGQDSFEVMKNLKHSFGDTPPQEVREQKRWVCVAMRCANPEMYKLLFRLFPDVSLHFALVAFDQEEWRTKYAPLSLEEASGALPILVTSPSSCPC